MRQQKKNKPARAPKNQFTSRSTGQQASTVTTRECPWVVTVKAGVRAFRSLNGVAKHYAGASDLWSEVQPGEIRFHFAVYDVAFCFVTFCLKREFVTSLRDDTRSGE